MSRSTSVIANETFSHQEVLIDDNAYLNCQFIQCRIVFTGLGPVRFEGCTFDRCNWVFSGPAETTLQFLSALYQGLDEGGKTLIEEIFTSVREGNQVAA